jgi:hypothetical protein
MRKQIASAYALDKAIYSNLVLERATEVCFLLAQVITTPARRKQ